MNGCLRCHTLTDATPGSTGLQAYLCSRCPVTAPCAAWTHAWRGWAPPGTWLCTNCGNTTTSIAISTAKVQAPQAPVPDDYC